MGSVTTPSDDKMIRAQVFDQCRWPDICCNELGISGSIESENGLDDIQKDEHEKKLLTDLKTKPQNLHFQSIFIFFAIMKTFVSQQIFSLKNKRFQSGFRWFVPLSMTSKEQLTLDKSNLIQSHDG